MGKLLVKVGGFAILLIASMYFLSPAKGPKSLNETMPAIPTPAPSTVPTVSAGCQIAPGQNYNRMSGLNCAVENANAVAAGANEAVAARAGIMEQEPLSPQDSFILTSAMAGKMRPCFLTAATPTGEGETPNPCPFTLTVREAAYPDGTGCMNEATMGKFGCRGTPDAIAVCGLKKAMSESLCTLPTN